MIAAIKGELLRKEPTKLLVMTPGGVGYEIFISLATYNLLASNTVLLHTVHQVREDGQALFGFATLEEKEMFLALLKITGIGGKVAISVCSTFSPQEFARIIASQELTLLKKVPGVGPKVASRIMVELAGFAPAAADAASAAFAETSQALESLGFKKEEIIAALKNLPQELPTPQLLREALKKLQKF